jgi:S-(hydroxymethyl)glutathione dehydrogenase/alcohol dehydrogenase
VRAWSRRSGPGVDDFAVGDHVVLNWAPACGRCFYCLHEQSNLCETYTAPIWAGTMLDGTTRLSRAGKPVYSYCGWRRSRSARSCRARVAS